MLLIQQIRSHTSTLWGILRKTAQRIKKRDIYVCESNPGSPWIFISYIPYVFFVSNSDKLTSHQNQQEMIQMVSVFSELGYNVYVMDYTSHRELPNEDIRIVFGVDPLFQRVCKRYPQAIKVYYATGAYYEHQTKMAIHMTDGFNEMYHSHIPYKRILAPHQSCQIADRILQIGSKFTLETYPDDIKPKITLIHQSTQSINPKIQIKVANGNEFVFMGSGGNALKGLGILIDYFTKHPDYILHVIGPLEYSVKEAVRTRLTPNVKLHGYLNIQDEQFASIVSCCNFQIYPSGSEGGCPGAVLNLMKFGIIPIVSKWSAFDEINEFGYMLKGLDVISIDEAINWALSQNNYDILRMKTKVNRFVLENYNIDVFTTELKKYFSSSCFVNF